jgi:hypothetical protein
MNILLKINTDNNLVTENPPLQPVPSHHPQVLVSLESYNCVMKLFSSVVEAPTKFIHLNSLSKNSPESL